MSRPSLKYTFILGLSALSAVSAAKSSTTARSRATTSAAAAAAAVPSTGTVAAAAPSTPAVVANSSSVSADTASPASIIAKLPPPQTIARIVAGDTEAQAAYQAILATGAAALSIPVKKMLNGTFVDGQYDGTTDPDCWWSYTTCKTPKEPGIPDDDYICPEPAIWGLTFDDGPTTASPALYDFLDAQSPPQKATLYYIGSNVAANYAVGKRAFQAGHQLCVHTWSHNYMTTLTNEQVFAELYYTKLAIKQLLGPTVSCWRPPYGDVDDRVRYFADSLDMRTQLWQTDTFDWELPDLPVATVNENYQYIYGNYSKSTDPTSGPIILTHEVSTYTVAEFIKQYPTILKNFDYIVPPNVCFNDTSPYHEPAIAGLWPTFDQYVAGNRPPTTLVAATTNNKIVPANSTDPTLGSNLLAGNAAAAAAGTAATAPAAAAASSGRKGSSTSATGLLANGLGPSGSAGLSVGGTTTGAANSLLSTSSIAGRWLTPLVVVFLSLSACTFRL